MFAIIRMAAVIGAIAWYSPANTHRPGEDPDGTSASWPALAQEAGRELETAIGDRLLREALPLRVAQAPSRDTLSLADRLVPWRRPTVAATR